MTGTKLRILIVAMLVSFAPACDSSSENEKDTGPLLVPEQYPTIGDAVDAAEDGDVIVVSPGTYSETVDFDGKAVTIRSTDPDDPDVVASTIIDGDGGPCVVTFQFGEGRDTVLEGVTVTGGTGGNTMTHGGGVCVWNNSGPVVRKNLITGNDAYVGGGVIVVDSWPLIEENRIVENVAESRGSGIFVSSGSDVTILDNLIMNNIEGSGAIHARDDDTTAIIEGNTIADNETDYGVGGIEIAYGASAEILDNGITGNMGSGDGSAGGITVRRAFASILNNDIIANEKDGGVGGAGITVVGHHSQDAWAEIESNLIFGNINFSSSGGAISVTYNSSAFIFDNIIEENEATAWGGGIFVYSLREDQEGNPHFVEIHANEIIDNIITGIDSGGGIAVRGGADVKITENLISSNVASEPGASGSRNGGGISVQLAHAVATIYDNIIENNYAGSRGGGVYIGQDSTVLGPLGESWERLNSPPSEPFNTYSGNMHEDTCGHDVFFQENQCD